MKRLAAILLALTLAAPCWAADAVIHLDTPAQTLYTRILLSASTSEADAMTEGTGNGVGRYVVDSSVITASAGVYPYKVFIGTPSQSAADVQVGQGVLRWSGTAAVDADATLIAQTAVTWIRTALGMAAADLDDQLDDVLAGAAGILTDVDQEPVPASRVFALVTTDAEGLVAPAKSVKVGADTTYAVDFRNDLPANGRIVTVASPEIADGTPGGVTFDDVGRDKSQAKFRADMVTAGTYECTVEATYDTGAVAVGTFTFVVAE